MRGRPFLEWLLFLAVWALLFLPLWTVTSGGGGRRMPSPAEGTSADERPVWLQITFSEPPVVFTLFSGGSMVLKEAFPEEDMEYPLALSWIDGAPDLELEAGWPGPGRRAVGMVVVPVDGKRRRTMLWSRDPQVRERVVFE